METPDKKSFISKYGIKVDVSGLTPDQVSKVRSMAENKGNYGAKASALANVFRQQNAKANQPQPIQPVNQPQGVQAPQAPQSPGITPQGGS